jgi:hypothetical protein
MEPSNDLSSSIVGTPTPLSAVALSTRGLYTRLCTRLLHYSLHQLSAWDVDTLSAVSLGC